MRAPPDLQRGGPRARRRSAPALAAALAALVLLLALSAAVAAAPVGVQVASGAERATLRLERVEIDRAGILLPDAWTTPAGGGSATWSPDFGTAAYSFPLPAAIPPAGAPVTLGVTVTAAPSARFAPALGISGDIDIQGSAFQVGALAEPGQTAAGSLPLRLVPRASAPGSAVRVTVGLQDGPRVTYHYRASAPPRRCAVPPRLRTQAQTRSCNYRVTFAVRQVREPIRNLARITTVAGGHFLVSLESRGLPARVCTPFGVDVRLLHEHVQPFGDDIEIRAQEDARACLRRRPATGRPAAMWVDVPLAVVRSDDGRCPRGSRGEMTARAGAPFPALILDLCGHREVFSPSRPGRPRSSAVSVSIQVR